MNITNAVGFLLVSVIIWLNSDYFHTCLSTNSASAICQISAVIGIYSVVVLVLIITAAVLAEAMRALMYCLGIE